MELSELKDLVNKQSRVNIVIQQDNRYKLVYVGVLLADDGTEIYRDDLSHPSEFSARKALADYILFIKSSR